MTRLIEWLLVSLIALVLSSAYLLDDPSDMDALHDGAASSQDAQQAADTLIRFAQAASQACGGENAAYVLIDDHTVQCSTKRGFKTITAKVVL